MKTRYKQFCALVLLIILQMTRLDAQLCLNGEVFLDANGTHELTAEEVLTLDLTPEYHVLISPSILTCSHIGMQTITVYVELEGDTLYNCTSQKLVRELTPPVALCTSNLHVTLDGFGPYALSVNELNNGSFDNCNVISYHILSDHIDCDDINPKPVTLIVTDASGNTNTCITSVSWDDYPGPNPGVIECGTDYVFHLEEGEDVTISPDMILEGGPYYCPDQYTVEIKVNGITRPEPELTLDDTNDVVIIYITDNETLNECWGDAQVIGVGGCEFVFNVCDTECHSAPLGDCASGHTDQDDVEWPCDVTISDFCQLTQDNPTPDVITLLHQGDSSDAKPNTNECLAQYINMGYLDQVIPMANGRQIRRTWSILHWESQISVSYVQNIFIEYKLTNICDTLPWNAPAGDCDSGHTLSDHVEWPADITIESVFTHPDDLDRHPQVLDQNVRPQLLLDCNPVSVSYQDFITRINDTIVVTERTWTIVDFYLVESWDYKQTITSVEYQNGSTVCVTRESGEPIPDVELIPGVFTDLSGCQDFANPTGIVVTPVKDSPLQDGVNLLDIILMREGILGIIQLSEYQRYAGDISGATGVTSLDVVNMYKLINGTLVPEFDHAWMFFEQVTKESSIDISDPNLPYKFIGVKMGDLDNSYSLGIPDREDSFLKANDEVLNNGETYFIPFYPDRTATISGFSIQIKNESQSLDFITANAFNLPDFLPHLTVSLLDDGISIVYLAPAGGAHINELEPLFILELKANANVVLHEEITLESSFDNILKPVGDEAALDLKFAWENVIISKVTTLDGLRKIEFFPNPVGDDLHIKGIIPDEKGFIIIMDPAGRVVLQTPIVEKIDLNKLETGLYYISFILEGQRTSGSALFKK